MSEGLAIRDKHDVMWLICIVIGSGMFLAGVIMGAFTYFFIIISAVPILFISLFFGGKKQKTKSENGIS